MTHPPDGRAIRRFSADHQSTEVEERALLALVSTGDRWAMDQLYIRYFARLARFFENMTVRVDLVEELVNDTMLEVWKAGHSIRADATVFLVIMRLAYSCAQKYFAEARADEAQSQGDAHDWNGSESPLAAATLPDLQILLSELPVEERAVLHLVYANGCSRRETAEIMKRACDSVDALLLGVRAKAKLYYSDTSSQGNGIGTL